MFGFQASVEGVYRYPADISLAPLSSLVTQVSHHRIGTGPLRVGAKGVFKRQTNDVVVPKSDPRTITSGPGTMEIGVAAPRWLVQDGRFVKIFCAVLRATFKTILPFKSSFRPHLMRYSCILGVRNLSLLSKGISRFEIHSK